MRHRGVTPDINVTPLVDIVLVLLIIFMVVVPQLEAGVAAAPPVARHVDPGAKAQSPLIVTVTRHGEVYLDKEPVSDVYASLRAAHRAQPHRPVQIRGDQNARYADVRRVFAVCQELGLPGVPLEVGDKKEDKEKS